MLMTIPRRLNLLVAGLFRFWVSSEEGLHESYDRSDLDDGEDEFSFTVRFHTKQVDDENGS